MFGLFGKLGEKIVCGVLDAAIAGIDTLDKATDILIDTTDNMFDKIEDIRSNVEDVFIQTELHAKEFKNSVQSIKEFSKSEYGRKTYLQDEIDYMNYNINKYKEDMKHKFIEINEDVAKVLKDFKTMKEKIRFTVSLYHISEEEALELLKLKGFAEDVYLD